MMPFGRKQKILASIAVTVLLLVAITYIRSPNIPEVSDAEFASAEPIDGTDVTISEEAYMALYTEMRKKEHEAFFNDLWYNLGNKDLLRNFDTSNISSEDIVSIKYFAALIEKSGIIDSAIHLKDNWWWISYWDILRVLIADFLTRNKDGDSVGASHSLDLLIRLNASVSRSKKVTAAEFMSISTSQVMFLMLAEDIWNTPQLRNDYLAKIRVGLENVGDIEIIYKRSLLSDSKTTPLYNKTFASFSNGYPLLSQLYDLEYMERYYRAIGRLQFPEATAAEIQTFRDSLPYCPTNTATPPYERSKLLADVHNRFLCPEDPFRSHWLTRWLTSRFDLDTVAYVAPLDFNMANGDGITINQKKKELLGKMMQISKKRNRPKVH